MPVRILLWVLFLPAQAVLAGLLLAADLFRLFFFPFRDRARPESTPSRSGLCSIVILNWNGRHLLEESLPALLRAVRYTGKEHEAIVVDNGSTDDSVEWVTTNFPGVRLVRLDENRGFGEGNNRGVEAARHDVVVLLNNDMIVEEDFLPPLLEPFTDPEVFAVSSQIFFPRGKRREETGNTLARWEWGYLHFSHEPIQAFHYRRRFLPVLWAGGGSSAFDRERFRSLSGFSSLFEPCYLEDTDLSYRAWRRGWKVLLAAESRVLHKHRSSSRVRFTLPALEDLVQERKLWYLWKNYQLKSLAAHLLWFPLNLTKWISLRTYLRSWRRLPQLLWLRAQEPRRVYRDAQIFEWVERPLVYLNRFRLQRSPRATDSSRPLRILTVSAYLPHLGYHGGAGRVFQLLFRVARKHQVSLVTFVETSREMEEIQQVLPHCRRVEAVYRGEYVPVSFFPYEPFEEFNCPALRERLERVLSEEDFDLVHFEWAQMAQYADLVPHLPKLLTEVEVDYAAHLTLVHLESNPWRKFRKLYNSLQTLYREVDMCTRVDRVVCVTDQDRNYLKDFVPSRKLCVVNTGVDTAYFAPDPSRSPEPDSLVFVGAFRHEPNVDAMHYFCREVFPILLERRPRTRLYIVGSSPPLSILELGKHPQVTVTGFVPDIREYYSRAQVVVVPLRAGVGIRGKILEGWAARKAMVATSLACQGIRAYHGHNIIIADEPREFARWTLALLRHPDFCRRLGKAGQETAFRYYDWSLLGEEMVKLYETLAGLSHRTGPADLASVTGAPAGEAERGPRRTC